MLVGLPAGTLPNDVDVAVAGTVSAAFVSARIRDAVERALVRQPGTTLDIHGITIPPTLVPGAKLEAQAGITLGGRGTFVDVSARTNVHVHDEPLPVPDPALLFYSDDPEYVGAPLAGVLIRGTIDAQTPARLFAYHVADGAPRQMWLALRAVAAARVQVLGTISGASPAYAYIGQQSTARFLAARASGESAIVTVAAGTPYVIGFGTMQPGDLIEAIEDLRVVDGGPVDVVLLTGPAVPAALPSLDGPELPGDSHGRRGVFALGGIAPLDARIHDRRARTAARLSGRCRIAEQTRRRTRAGRRLRRRASARAASFEPRAVTAKRLSVRTHQRRGRRDRDVLVRRRSCGHARAVRRRRRATAPHQELRARRR